VGQVDGEDQVKLYHYTCDCEIHLGSILAERLSRLSSQRDRQFA
jgi:hypothetical protein